MTVLWGTIVNALGIIVGGLAGVALPAMRPEMKRTVLQGLGLALCVLGVTMALKTEHFFEMAVSLAAGGVIGEAIRIESLLERLGAWLERQAGRLGRRKGQGSALEPASGEKTGQLQPESGLRRGRLAEGFVSATLVFCVGAMAILGAMDSGLRHDHQVLYTKAMLDGFFSVLFASTQGIGVVFSAVPILLYQGGIALASSSIASLLTPAQLDRVIADVTGVGGVLIIGIGLNILDIKKIHVANLLPAVLVAAVWSCIAA